MTELKAAMCHHCDFGTGQRGMDRCPRCDGAGSVLWVAGKSYPNTEEGHVKAMAALSAHETKGDMTIRKQFERALNEGLTDTELKEKNAAYFKAWEAGAMTDILERLRTASFRAVEALQQQAARIKELETERDALRRVWNMTQASEIEAATIERCAQEAEGMTGRTRGPITIEVAQAIRALAKPPEKEED